MYFMPRSTKLCRAVAPLQSPYRYTVTTLGLIIMSYAWYAIAYIPFKSRLATMQASVAAYRQQEHTKKSATLQSSLETDVDVVRCSLRDYNSAWKTGGVEQLFGYATSAGLAFLSFDIITKQKESWYAQDTVTLRLQGTCEQLLRFFSLLGSSDMKVLCEHIDATSGDGKTFTFSCMLTALMASC